MAGTARKATDNEPEHGSRAQIHGTDPGNGSIPNIARNVVGTTEASPELPPKQDTPPGAGRPHPLQPLCTVPPKQAASQLPAPRAVAPSLAAPPTPAPLRQLPQPLSAPSASVSPLGPCWPPRPLRAPLAPRPPLAACWRL